MAGAGATIEISDIYVYLVKKKIPFSNLEQFLHYLKSFSNRRNWRKKKKKREKASKGKTNYILRKSDL